MKQVDIGGYTASFNVGFDRRIICDEECKRYFLEYLRDTETLDCIYAVHTLNVPGNWIQEIIHKSLHLKTLAVMNNPLDLMKRGSAFDDQGDFPEPEPEPLPVSIYEVWNNMPPGLEEIRLQGLREDSRLLCTMKIQSLKNVTSLVLSKTYECVNDEVLHAIFSYMTKLNRFELVGGGAAHLGERICRIPSTTENGFLGPVFKGFGCKAVHDPAKAISNLKGLHSLVLQGCDVTDQVLEQAIAFKHLEYLDITWNEKVTLTGVYAALGQNPALETFHSGRILVLKDGPARIREVTEKHARLKYCDAIGLYSEQGILESMFWLDLD